MVNSGGGGGGGIGAVLFGVYDVVILMKLWSDI